MELLASNVINVSGLGYNCGITKGSQMNLDEFKAHVEATRLSNLAIAMEALSKSYAIQAAQMSVLPDTITTTTTKEGN
jgi:hypothetical protein